MRMAAMRNLLPAVSPSQRSRPPLPPPAPAARQPGGAADGAASGAAAAPGAPKACSLMAYPAYDNFSGKINPAEWVAAVQAKSTAEHEWRVVWDTAAYAPCHPIDLRAVPADFACISFYKLFGLGTGVGALIMKKDIAARMRKVRWLNDGQRQGLIGPKEPC